MRTSTLLARLVFGLTLVGTASVVVGCDDGASGDLDVATSALTESVTLATPDATHSFYVSVVVTGDVLEVYESLVNPEKTAALAAHDSSKPTPDAWWYGAAEREFDLVTPALPLLPFPISEDAALPEPGLMVPQGDVPPYAEKVLTAHEAIRDTSVPVWNVKELPVIDAPMPLSGQVMVDVAASAPIDIAIEADVPHGKRSPLSGAAYVDGEGVVVDALKACTGELDVCEFGFIVTVRAATDTFVAPLEVDIDVVSEVVSEAPVAGGISVFVQ